MPIDNEVGDHYLFHPRDPWSVAMKVNWPGVIKVTMVVSFFKVVLNGCFQGWSKLSVTSWVAQNRLVQVVCY